MLRILNASSKTRSMIRRAQRRVVATQGAEERLQGAPRPAVDFARGEETEDETAPKEDESSHPRRNTERLLPNRQRFAFDSDFRPPVVAAFRDCDESRASNAPEPKGANVKRDRPKTLEDDPVRDLELDEPPKGCPPAGFTPPRISRSYERFGSFGEGADHRLRNGESSSDARAPVEAATVARIEKGAMHGNVARTLYDDPLAEDSPVEAPKETAANQPMQKELPETSAPQAENDSCSEADLDPEPEEASFQDLSTFSNFDHVYVVETAEQASHAVERLRAALEEDPERIFACDTEATNIDVLKESPRGHGSVTCFSVYCGEFNFGEADRHQTHLWVDTLGRGEDAAVTSKQIWDAFRKFLENPDFLKVWHNYGFDRHVLTNDGICCRGFGGDTLHMARLWDSSRKGKGYTLESLSTAKELGLSSGGSRKISMKKLFGVPKLKADGTPGKILLMPTVEQIQLSEESRPKWIHYSTRDSKATFDLYHRLRANLQNVDRFACDVNAAVRPCYAQVQTLWDFYSAVWRPFGELLTDMEHEGFYVDTLQLAAAQIHAEKDRAEAAQRFKKWAELHVKGGQYMNPSSDAQVRTMLFGGLKRKKRGSKEDDRVETVRKIKVSNPDYEAHIREGRTGRKPKKMIEVEVHSLWGERDCPLKPEIYTQAGLPAVSAAGLMTLIGKPGKAAALLEEKYGVAAKKNTSDLSTANVSMVSAEDSIPLNDTERAYNRELEAMGNGLGQLYTAFEDPREGLEACVAVEALVEINAIDTLLSSFILPLQGDQIKTRDGRIHASMNINTETGRLSCRRPNLQNQPAAGKDRYKVRNSFRAKEGCILVVADYGQLELRVLAQLTGCKSMLEAFDHDGDFHSRTAAGMYDNIREAIAAGKVALEKASDDHEDLQEVKDAYPEERRKAKILNFSIAYGKTPHGLSKDWDVSLEEAGETLERWYSDRQEVRKWQLETTEEARGTGYVRTLLGRRRNLPDLNAKLAKSRSHAERASINTPIQGSAADIVTAAMLCIDDNARLKELGFRLISQIHDEVILEGPKEFAEEAKALVIECMESPFPAPDGTGYCNPLDVALMVDCKAADTWLEAK